MTEYLVTWSMPIEADDPVDAAQQALGIHRNPSSIATVFIVEFDDPDTNEGRTVKVDLHSDATVNEVMDL